MNSWTRVPGESRVKNTKHYPPHRLHGFAAEPCFRTKQKKYKHSKHFIGCIDTIEVILSDWAGYKSQKVIAAG